MAIAHTPRVPARC